MNHCMIHLQGILGGMVEMFPIERLQLLCHFLPKEQPYHCCLIIKEPYSWAVRYCWNQATPSQLERNGTLWNGTVSLRGRKGGHRSLPNNGDQLPFDLHWHQSTIFEQMKKMKNFERRATNQQLSIWTCFMQAYIRVDVFPNMGVKES